MSQIVSSLIPNHSISKSLEILTLIIRLRIETTHGSNTLLHSPRERSDSPWIDTGPTGDVSKMMMMMMMMMMERVVICMWPTCRGSRSSRCAPQWRRQSNAFSQGIHYLSTSWCFLPVNQRKLWFGDSRDHAERIREIRCNGEVMAYARASLAANGINARSGRLCVNMDTVSRFMVVAISDLLGNGDGKGKVLTRSDGNLTKNQ